jgi:hypothetical protein
MLKTFVHDVSARFLNITSRRLSSNKIYTVVFVTPEKEEIKCPAKEGQSLLEVAHENDVELEGISLGPSYLI